MESKPTCYFVLGGPGAGKGTVCARLVDEFGYVHLSAGDLLRAERHSGSDDAKIINDHIDKGLMVPGDITINLMKKAMKGAGWASKKYLIDGFPRNEENIDGWNRVMNNEANVAGVLYLECSKDTMIERVVKRAKEAGANARKDDTAECMEKRHDVFMQESKPIVDKYAKEGLVLNIDAKYPAKAVFSYVKKALGLSNYPMDIPIPAPRDDEYREIAWGLEHCGDKFKPLWINKPKCGPKDVRFEILYSGICHSDCHLGQNDLNDAIFPMVPGHELAGKVIEVGKDVTKVKVGDHVGVGTIKDTCLNCEFCKRGDIYCVLGNQVHTYNSLKRKGGHIGGNPDTQNFGGYACSEVVQEDFILKVPQSMDIKVVGPLMCAGATLYDPLVHWGATKGDRKMNIGVCGIGGLGTLGIKFAKGYGHTVYAISTSAHKEKMAKEKGADFFVNSRDEASMKAAEATCDLILNTISAPHELADYIPLLRTNGTLVQLGLVTEKHSLNQLLLLPKRKSVAGSMPAGIPVTQEMIDFCAEKNIVPDVETVTARQIDECWDKLTTINKDGVRYVIDVKKSLEDKEWLPAKE